MNRISSFYIIFVAIAILFLSQFCAFAHGNISGNLYRTKRSPDDESIQSQQQQMQYIAPNMDATHKNSSKDRYKDKIIFDHDDKYTSKTTERILDSPLFPPLIAIRSNPLKSNETNHLYSCKSNGEYEFR